MVILKGLENMRLTQKTWKINMNEFDYYCID